MVKKKLWMLKSLAHFLAGRILWWWFFDSRSDSKKDEHGTGHPGTTRQRGSCPLDQESTLDMVLLDVILYGQKRSLGQQKVPDL
ncbi:Protection of telomeres protein 1b [Zea mays]|jgi:hypothetical protein|uniref:Protection of telomeres protein 1b n=1 Tax=Zea mays TaxID=4577 RepID=A0A1D6JHZ0_MAIZE|nr:Protection of telomeres protein 1b [Zea mays]